MNRTPDTRTILTVDIGNTAVKAALFEGDRMVDSIAGIGICFADIERFAVGGNIDAVCCCCVGDDHDDIAGRLTSLGVPVLLLNADTPLPIAVDYDRRRLGVDRVAAAVGVSSDDCPVLIVDAGTAVTLDLVAGGRFLGGNISPGLKLRFRSLHAFTSRLPLVAPEGPTPVFGFDTQTAIRAGVVNGLVAEICAAYRAAGDRYDNIKLVLTGGDAALIAPLLRQHGLDPVDDSETVGRGLVRIYNYNQL